MPDSSVPVLCGLAGVSAYAALLHGQLASQSPMRAAHVLFAVLCMLATLCLIAAVGEVGAETVEEASSLRQLGVTVSMLYLAVLPWFIREYTRLRSRALPIVQSCVLLIIPAAEWLLSPLAVNPLDVRNTWLCVLWVVIGSTLAWCIYASRHQFQVGMRREALALGVALLLLLALLLTNLLSDLGVQGVPRLGVLGLVALVIPMNVELDREARQSRSNLQAVLENLPAVAYAKSAEGRYPLADRAFECVLGKGSARVIGKTDSDVPPHNATGTPEELRSLSSDVTDLPRTEQEIQSLRNHAWHADRVQRIAALAASLAHELTQPLTAILSNAQAGMRFMSKENVDLDEIRAILSDIVRDEKRAAGVINGLRAMLRRQDVPRERIDLSACVEEVIDLMHSEFLERDVDVGQSIVPHCMVMSDKTKLQQVMLNLMANACDAMATVAKGERHLWISLSRSGETEARIAIRDSGPAIPDEQLSRVFESFYTTKPQGLGMGLAVCGSIIKSLGGNIQVERNRDRGVTFLFTLPLEKMAEAAIACPVNEPFEATAG